MPVIHNDVGLGTARVDCAVSTLTALGSKEVEMRIIGCAGSGCFSPRLLAGQRYFFSVSVKTMCAALRSPS